mgnify:CR=1 FL=1
MRSFVQIKHCISFEDSIDFVIFSTLYLPVCLCSFLLNLLFIIHYLFFMNIYIGNLSYKVRENDLQGVLEEYGKVDSCKIVKDRETGKSKGFGFAEMSDDAAATKAIEELNGAEFDGRTMVVKEARPKA